MIYHLPPPYFFRGLVASRHLLGDAWRLPGDDDELDAFRCYRVEDDGDCGDGRPDHDVMVKAS